MLSPYSCSNVIPRTTQVVKSLMTNDFSLNDYCEFVTLSPECECIVSVPSDPNILKKAAYVVFTPVKGDFSVSLTGATEFSDRPSCNAPLLNPAGFPVSDLAEFRVYSLSGCLVKVCWYLDIPRGVKVDRSPLSANSIHTLASANRNATV